MPRLPACTPTDVVRALTRAGFFFHHARGSHHAYKHPARPGLVVVPVHVKDVKRGTLHGILKQAGLTRDDFLKLL